MEENNSISIPSLTTEHYILRQLKAEDENEIFIMRSDENNLRYLDRQKAERIEDVRIFLKKIKEGISKNDMFFWAIVPKNKRKLVGTICLWNISHEKSTAEIGFELLPEHQGKGVIQEALPAAIKFGFENMSLKVIEGEVDPENIKSIKLLEKYGFTLSKKLETTAIYSLLKR